MAPERVALIHALGRYSTAGLDDSAIDTLLAVHAAHSGFATAGGFVWIPATGLSGSPGSTGNTNGQPCLVLNAAGEGLVGLSRPTLGLSKPTGNLITLSWHSGFSDWILQESTDFSAGDWHDSSRFLHFSACDCRP